MVLGDYSVLDPYSALFLLNFIIRGARLGAYSFLSSFLGYIFSIFYIFGYSFAGSTVGSG